MTDNLPRQLQRQAEDAARIEQEIADAQAPPALDDPASLLETPAVPDGSEPAKRVHKAPDPVPTDDQWRQRYLTLDGKYKAEVPRLHNDVKELKSQLAAISARLEKPTVPDTAKARKPQLVTDKDTETYGAELLDLIKRQAEDIVSDREASLESSLAQMATENENLKSKIAGVSDKQTQTAQDSYIARFAARVPDWETTNVDPDFLGWLRETDPLSGMSRQDYLDNAAQAMDVDRTVRLFETFKALRAPAATVSAPRSATEIQRQVTPGKSKTAPATAQPSADKVWTYTEVETFYKDQRRGVYANNPDDVKRIEAEIDLAASQGRIR